MCDARSVRLPPSESDCVSLTARQFDLDVLRRIFDNPAKLSQSRLASHVLSYRSLQPGRSNRCRRPRVNAKSLRHMRKPRQNRHHGL